MRRIKRLPKVGMLPAALMVVSAAMAAIALKPLVLINHANLLWLQGETQGARDSFAQALALRPHDARLGVQQAHLLGSVGDWNGAFNALSHLPPPVLNVPEHARRYTAAAIFTRHLSVAVSTYTSAEQRLELPPNLAIALLGAVHQSSYRELDVVRALAARSFNLDPSSQKANQLSRDLAKGGTTDSGTAAIREAITWLSRPLPSVAQNLSVPDMSQIAALLGVPVTTLTLGSELIDNGDFEDVNPVDRLPNGWEAHWWIRQPDYNLALFVVGVDCARQRCSGRALRVDGVSEALSSGSERARAGMWHPMLILEPGATYVASFEYRTPFGALEYRPSAFFSIDPLAFLSEVELPPTHGKWKAVTILGWNRTGAPASVVPLFRLWGEGTTWFDNVSLRQVHIGSMIAPRESIVDFRDSPF